MKDSKAGCLVVFETTIFAIIFGFGGYLCGCNDGYDCYNKLNKELVERNIKQYNTKTGKLEWINE